MMSFLDHTRQRAGYRAEVSNEAAVEVGETQESL